jgi:hypothetical protein
VTVAAVGVAHSTAGALGIGLGAVVGLVTGLLGGISIHLMRRMNARAVRSNTAALERGDVNVIVRLHVTSILRDAARAALVTGTGLALGAGVHALMVDGGMAVRGAIVVAVVIIGAAARRGRRRHAAPRGAWAGHALVRGRVARRRRRRVVAVRPPLGRCLLRLFTVQGSWNYERMLGIGFGVAGEPLVRDLPPEQYRAAMARGAHFFNAPYLCGLARRGRARRARPRASQQVERLRTAPSGPLGSLGDRLVWAGWLPLNSGLALVGIALGLGWWAIAGFLAVYNLGHVSLRWWALRAGWTHGLRVVDALRDPLLRRAGAFLAPAMAAAIGAALPLAVGYLGGPLPGWARLLLGGAVAAGVLLLRWRALGLTGLRLGLGFAAIGLIVASVWR